MPKRVFAPVRPLWTWESGTCPTRMLWDAQGNEVRVASVTAARAACRKAGYRVLTVNGTAQLAQEQRKHPDGTITEIPVWYVTVRP